ncbi:hypothetical protein CLOM_g20375, partial [Closterium sp. NIES-68]
MSSLTICRPSAATLSRHASPRQPSSSRDGISQQACSASSASSLNGANGRVTIRAPLSRSVGYRVADVSGCRSERATRAAASSSSSSSPAFSVADVSAPLSLTYLEGNSWLWSVDGVKVLVDPIIEGPLDFGIPWLYCGYKKVLKSLKLDDVIDADLVLITQSLDD